MAWSPTAGTLLGFGAAAVSTSLAALAWRHRSERIVLPFLGLMGTLATWSAIYGLQLGFQSLATQLAWQRLTLGIAGFVPAAWLLFTLYYSRQDSWLTRSRVAVLGAEPVAFLLLCLTNPVHGLIWTTATFRPVYDGHVPALAFAPGYYVHIAYAYLTVVAGIVILLVLGWQASEMYQKQVELLVAGAVPPFLSHVAFTLGTSPVPHLDLTPFLFAFTGVVFGLALFRFRLLKLTPIATVQSLGKMGDGLIVIDDDATIVDVLGVADDVFDPPPAVGESFTDLFGTDGVTELDGTIHVATVDGQRRTYQLQVAPVVDHRDQAGGQMIMVRDVTGLRESEQRLEVSNRVLRHNLRNEMNVVLGYARALEERLSGADAADARVIRETATDLLDLSEKARRITQLEAGADERSTIDLVEELSGILDDFREEYPGVRMELDAPEDIRIAVVTPDTFRIAVRNVLENAVEHNDAETPRVTVTVESTGQEVRIDVSDNGSGLPDLERTVIGAGMETPTEHSRGLGLWLTYWCVTLSDGDLDFDTDGPGTTVTLEFPQPATDSGVPA